ncbi:pyruvate:ferredoxin (flavodoxin) oxidoreductase [Veillonella sp. R32]|uniref:pyruvate:ferredoxin (flavodoxin) oxidoreductase n=1 Tax=Veillonella sp. R32 TaxID=2021312 RepID=UPI00138A4F04|nr:pyruvate:ferredoxin (flavodoxin) oxidoreductase [Veillonella sp. R32]KAF1683151.1 pyruvate:ferredoxin (flavodoxin) oxidoreductase [Veillonella sp. R32]
MERIKKTMDGNEAAAYASYAFTEVAAIYPITPSSPMAEHVDSWSAAGKKNIFGQPVKLVEMQSEAGAIAAVHGAADGGSLCSTYTASQGLMLMIPTMFRIAGQLKSTVLHVASRNVATHAISIDAEQSDVMACRQTGFAILASSSVQEAMDLGAVAHLSTIKGHVPFMHFFDGFRTSHEIQKIDCLKYEDLAELVDYDELNKFKKNALNPEYPVLRTTGQYSDTYFQSREACNAYYDAIPDIVADYMRKIGELTGRNYKPFNYYGAPDAEHIIIGMGSLSGTAQETVDYLTSQGEKVGYIDVHLYRPFSPKYFLDVLPDTVKSITVGDRTKEPGAMGEPLYEDVCSLILEHKPNIKVYACRYGLAGKDMTPHEVITIFKNMKNEEPKNHYTIGITDDVTFLSIPVERDDSLTLSDAISCKFWGLGSDGTVGANKNTIKIIGDHTDMYVQAYFEYDGKKSGGLTRSHLRFGNTPIRSTYLVKSADFVACHNKSYIGQYDLLGDVKNGGSVLISCNWSQAELEEHLPIDFKMQAAKKNIKLYTIDATGIAQELGLGSRTNTILQAAFFKITKILPQDKAAQYMKDAILKSYGHKGENIINMNNAAVDRGFEGVVEVEVPKEWADLVPDKVTENSEVPFFISEIQEPVNKMVGNDIPVSTFVNYADGTVPQGTSKFEKRGIAVNIPIWDAEKCVQCNQCSYVCPHAAIRPFLVDPDEANAAPETFITAPLKGIKDNNNVYRIQVAALDCVGCGSCANVCPAPGKALTMQPLDDNRKEAGHWDYAMTLSPKVNPMGKNTVKGSQFEQPLLEFPGACPGCGETPYAKLITQLFGDRMYVATATGCSQVWATSFPSFPYTTNALGHGPAVAGSLFENNAEFGLGIYLSVEQQRERLRSEVEQFVKTITESRLKDLLNTWLEKYDDEQETKVLSLQIAEALAEFECKDSNVEKLFISIKNSKEHFSKKSIWLFGGDGWAYDIGFGGLDHVIASGANVNILVFDTEVYSNTGGQASKATPTGAVAEFAAAGKTRKKKDLGMMAMSYGDVYVAQVSMGANQNQFLKAVLEAESYNGPSLIICYAPCINHGLKCGMNKVQNEMKDAVDTGYWQLYRYDPRRIDLNENPFILDSKEPNGKFLEFIRGEVRYASLEKKSPELAQILFERSEAEAMARYNRYKSLANK